jgi:hypothetical protein
MQALMCNDLDWHELLALRTETKQRKDKDFIERRAGTSEERR